VRRLTHLYNTFLPRAAKCAANLHFCTHLKEREPERETDDDSNCTQAKNFSRATLHPEMPLAFKATVKLPHRFWGSRCNHTDQLTRYLDFYGGGEKRKCGKNKKEHDSCRRSAMAILRMAAD
jgi:hypothetical protein